MEKDQLKAEEYKESFYNFKLHEEEGKLLIYNTKTGVLVFESDIKEIETIKSILDNPNKYKGHAIFEQFLKIGLIIPKDKDELKDIKFWHEEYSRLKNTINLTILPAEACNFACPYCFIYKQRPLFMSDEVFDRIYKYLEKNAKENTKGTVLELCWFGGEPLLAIDKIINFSKRLEILENDYPFKTKSSIVTNGYYLTPEVMNNLLDCNITNIQVTIDGDRDSHDQLRILKDGSPTFDIIYQNLKKIKENIAPDRQFCISVRANFLRSNLDSMNSLLDKFITDFGEDDRFKIYYRPVYNFETTRSDVNQIVPEICSLSEGLDIQVDFAFRTMMLKQSDFEKARIYDPLPQPTYTWCNAIRINSSIIGADGSVFVCDSYITEKDQSVGELSEDGEIVLNENGKKWKISVFDEDNIEKCLACKLFPICTGGCRRARMTNQEGCLWSEEHIYKSMRDYITININ